MPAKWKSLPNWNDEKARINERIHTKSGAKLIEILYGAEDSSHNPTYPSSRSDGHGHWIALEIDGVYNIIFWRRSYSLRLEKQKELLGRQECGPNNSDYALGEIEDSISRKENLCTTASTIAREVTNLVGSSNAKTKISEVFKKIKEAQDKWQELLTKWKAIQNWNTPRENELWKEFHEASDKIKTSKKNFQAEVERIRSKNKDAKNALVAEASRLSTSGDWKQTGDRLKELMEQWKSIGSAGKDEDDKLWEQFDKARKEFFERRKRYYAEQDEKHDKAKRLKLDLIEKAIFAVKLSSFPNTTSQNIKDTSDRLNDIMNQWKAAGSAGKDHDDNLWEQLNNARQKFNDTKQTFYKQRDDERARNRAEKNRICSEASAIANSGNYSRENADRMRKLSDQWRSTGSAGEQDEYLWNTFNGYRDTFRNGQRREADRKHDEWLQRTRERIYRKEEQRSKLYGALERVREQLNRTKNYLRERELMERVRDLESKIEQLTREIYEMKSRS